MRVRTGAPWLRPVLAGGAFLVAIGLGLIALGYFDAQPHVARVWHVVWAAPHGSRRRATPPATRFTKSEDCTEAKLRFEQSADVTGAYCASEQALLWSESARL